MFTSLLAACFLRSVTGQKVGDPLRARYVKGMKTTATKKQNRQVPRKQNPFACKGWGEFFMRSVRADQAARVAARARVTATGETLH